MCACVRACVCVYAVCVCVLRRCRFSATALRTFSGLAGGVDADAGALSWAPLRRNSLRSSFCGFSMQMRLTILRCAVRWTLRGA